MKILLASTSRYRVAQLKSFGLRFDTQKPTANEEALKKSVRLSPRALSRFLAKKKAESLAATRPRHVVIGADQLVSFNGKILGKPGTASNARRMLAQMSGKTHQLITSHCVIHGRKKYLSTVTANITLRKLSKREIADYVKLDSPLDCAGSYKFECAGLSLVKRLSVADPSSLTGLSLMAIHGALLKISILTGEPIPFKTTAKSE